MSAAKLSPLTARQELEVDAKARTLLPFLFARGLEAEDALAIATNVCLIHAAMVDRPDSPAQLLEIYSLTQIAELAGAVSELAQPAEWEVAE
ncbi:MAG: hypothetical protein FWE32_10810 [Oscillospiraceae bacterium]|nr:hypothetical protein [Oscillospiraceae bacterium]